MNCNTDIHDELSDSGEISCPFCDQNLGSNDKPKDCLVANELCCSDQYIEHNNGMNVCLNCGLVHGYNNVTEYIDYYENIYRIHRKSVYHRRYHIENVLNDICFNQRVELTHNQRDQIYKVFVMIGKILDEVNGTRKRMISVNFIMRRIFKMMGLPYKIIPISKSKKTLAFYDKYWASIMSLIGDKIKSIIQ